MAGILFKLETPERTPAEPSSLSSAVPNGGRVMRFPSTTRRCGLLLCEMMTPTRLRC